MISVIVCSNKEPSWDIHRAHVAKTVGCEHKYIRIDNFGKGMGICGAYNEGVDKASGDILVFVHEDVFFISPNWGNTLKEKFSHDSSLGLIGLAGTQYFLEDNQRWFAAGRPFIKGRVVHERKNEGQCSLTIFSHEEKDTEVVVVDGLFFAVRRSLFDGVRFDEETFDRFHFYDLDICMQIRRTHKLIVTDNILVKHLSGGNFDDTWNIYAKKFYEKYRDELPATCCDQIPDRAKHVPFESVPLEKVTSAETIDYIKGLDAGLPQEVLSGPSAQVRDKGIIAVTGMHRSGTSCITGLLSHCGYSLGASQGLLNHNAPKFDNQKGHFENVGVVTINDAILRQAGGSWCALPPQEVVDVTETFASEHIRRFSGTFDGDLIKDPRLCLTLNLWGKHCPNLSHVVICLRHPMSIALSLQARNNFRLETGLYLWFEYNIRLLENIKQIPTFVVDYDSLTENLEDELFALLQAIESSLNKNEMRERINGFYEKNLNHNPVRERETEKLPDNFRELYEILKHWNSTARRETKESPGAGVFQRS